MPGLAVSLAWLHDEPGMVGGGSQKDSGNKKTNQNIWKQLNTYRLRWFLLFVIVCHENYTKLHFLSLPEPYVFLTTSNKVQESLSFTVVQFFSSIFYVLVFYFSRTFLASRQPPVAESARLPFQAASGGIPLHSPAGGGGFIPSQPASQSRHPSPKPASQPVRPSHYSQPVGTPHDFKLFPNILQWTYLMITLNFHRFCKGCPLWFRMVSIHVAMDTTEDFIGFP